MQLLLLWALWTASWMHPMPKELLSQAMPVQMMQQVGSVAAAQEVPLTPLCEQHAAYCCMDLHSGGRRWQAMASSQDLFAAAQ